MLLKLFLQKRITLQHLLNIEGGIRMKIINLLKRFFEVKLTPEEVVYVTLVQIRSL